MRVGLLKSGLGWVDTVERLLLDPTPKGANPVSRPQILWERPEKSSQVNVFFWRSSGRAIQLACGDSMCLSMSHGSRKDRKEAGDVKKSDKVVCCIPCYVQDTPETAQKGAPVTKESKEEFRGPDTSSLTAFLLSLLSCSEAGVRCADVGESADDYHEVREGPAEPSTSKGKPRVRKSQSADVANKEQGRNAVARGRTSSEDPEESEWQLVSEQDLEMEGTVGSVPGQKQRALLPPEQLPVMSEDSVLLTEDFRSFVYSALPTLARGRQWVLLYSTRKHGISLLTLYRRSSLLAGPCLLVAGDTKGTVFGGLLSAPLKATPKKKYQGSSESFVYTNVSGKPKIFRPTGMNRYFVLCTNESLAFGGGGHFALNLDSELLNGSSGSCDTYGSYCLASSEEFTVKDVELWGFAHTSRYTPRSLSFKEPPEAPGVCRW